MKKEEKKRIRSKDRQWASNTFFPRWRDQFEIHHDYNNGCFCFFLTPRQHAKIEGKYMGVKKNGK